MLGNQKSKNTFKQFRWQPFMCRLHTIHKPPHDFGECFWMLNKFKNQRFVSLRGGSNPCGQSPTYFKSIPLIIRTQCRWMGMQFMFAWKRKRGHLRCQPPDCNRYGRPHLLFRHRWQHVNLPRTTPRGFESLRAEPNGFRVHLLNHSDTVSIRWGLNC